jgi:hypothetical protein
LDEFKVDLKISILKLDDQIKDKVDTYNFQEYGRKVDSKINSEMSKKIDKNELKRNNNIINKKVSLLVYKLISKNKYKKLKLKYPIINLSLFNHRNFKFYYSIKIDRQS